jgi:hypothetical protein
VIFLCGVLKKSINSSQSRSGSNCFLLQAACYGPVSLWAVTYLNPLSWSASASASPPPSACSQPLPHRHSFPRPAFRFLPERLSPSEQVAAAGGGQGRWAQGSREPPLQSGARRRRRGLTGSGRGTQGRATGGRQRAAAPAPAQQRLARGESEFPSFCKFKLRHPVIRKKKKPETFSLSPNYLVKYVLKNFSSCSIMCYIFSIRILCNFNHAALYLYMSNISFFWL